MHPTKALLSGLVVAALVAAPLSSASAAWRHRGLVPDLFGAAAAVVVGAATIATAPLAIIAGARPRAYYGSSQGYAYDGPPRGYYGSYQGYAYDGPPRGYYSGSPGYAYDGPPRGYYGPPRDYGPPPGYYPPRPQYYGPPPGY